jgi:hypothetical protein
MLKKLSLFLLLQAGFISQLESLPNPFNPFNPLQQEYIKTEEYAQIDAQIRRLEEDIWSWSLTLRDRQLNSYQRDDLNRKISRASKEKAELMEKFKQPA